MRRLLSCITITVTTMAGALFARPAQAEGLTPPMPRQGYYLSVGLGAAVNRADDREHHSTRTFNGGGISLRAGEMVNDWLGFGLRLDGALAQDNKQLGELAGYGADIQVVPITALRTLAFHVGAGVGLWRTKGSKPDDELRGVAGGYYSAGVTWDLFLSRANRSGGIALTPGVFVKYLPGSTYNSVTLWTGLGLSLWSGLDRKALELAPEDAFERE